MLLVMTAAVAACIAGCSKEDIEAAREGAKDASELLNEHAVSLQEGLEFRSKDREK